MRGSTATSSAPSVRVRSSRRMLMNPRSQVEGWCRPDRRSRPAGSRSRGRRRRGRATRRRTSAMSATMSAARPPSSAWMKLACLGDTSAEPSRRPRAPAASMRRPAESPGGLVNTEPALAPPGWCSRRHRTMSAISGLGSGPIAGRERQIGREHHLRRTDRRAAVAKIEVGGRHPYILPRRQVEHADPFQHLGHVRAVAAGVHPHRAPDRARARRRPTRSRSGRRPRCAGPPPAGWPRPRRSPGGGPSVAIRLGSHRRTAPPARTASPAKPGVGDQQVRTPTHHQHRDAGRAPRWRPRSSRVVVVVDRDQQRRRPAHPVGRRRARAARRGGPGRPAARRPARRPQRTADTAAQLPLHLFGQRGEVAGAQREAEVAGAQLVRQVADDVAPPGQVGQPTPRVVVEHGLGDQLAGDARAGAPRPTGRCRSRPPGRRRRRRRRSRARGRRCGCSGAAGTRTRPGPSRPGRWPTARWPPRSAGGRSRR